jgi:hypothetical protein
MRANGIVLSPGVELTKKYGTLKTQKDKNYVSTHLKLEKHLKPLSRSKSNEFNAVKGKNRTYKIKNVNKVKSKVKSKSNKHDEIIYGKKRTFYVKNK